MSVGTILLAAGSARRMGEDKLLVDLGGKPLCLYALHAIRAALLEGPIVAVTPGSAVRPLFEGQAKIVEVQDHALGMGHSLAAAVRKVPIHWTAAIVMLADMPFVLPLSLMALARDARPDSVIRPAYAGEPGNPVLWGRNHFARLEALTGDKGGRDLFASLPVEQMELADPGLTMDVDTPEALEKARRWLAGA